MHSQPFLGHIRILYDCSEVDIPFFVHLICQEFACIHLVGDLEFELQAYHDHLEPTTPTQKDNNYNIRDSNIEDGFEIDQ